MFSTVSVCPVNLSVYRGITMWPLPIPLVSHKSHGQASTTNHLLVTIENPPRKTWSSPPHYMDMFNPGPRMCSPHIYCQAVGWSSTERLSCFWILLCSIYLQILNGVRKPFLALANQSDRKSCSLSTHTSRSDCTSNLSNWHLVSAKKINKTLSSEFLFETYSSFSWKDGMGGGGPGLMSGEGNSLPWDLSQDACDVPNLPFPSLEQTDKNITFPELCLQVISQNSRFSCANEKSLHWIEMLWCYVIVHKYRIFHLNHLVNSNLIWTGNEFCYTIHQISHIHHIMEYLAEWFSIQSDIWILSIPFSQVEYSIIVQIPKVILIILKIKWLASSIVTL